MFKLLASIFKRVVTAVTNPFRMLVVRIQRMFNVNILTAKLIPPLTKKVKALVTLKPQSPQDYFSVGRYWVYKKLMLTVVFVLAPMYGPDGHYVMLLTSSMLYNHFLNPVTAFLSFVLLERAPALPRRAIGCAMAPTLVYGGIMLAANVARVYKGPYPFFYVYEQPLWVSGMWVVVILGGALLIAWMVWKLGGGRRAA